MENECIFHQLSIVEVPHRHSYMFYSKLYEEAQMQVGGTQSGAFGEVSSKLH